MLLYNLNKKGTLGTTLTWFVAFIIIFVLMFTFIMATGWLALKKIFMVGGGNDIDIQGNTIQPISFNNLNSILNSEDETGVTIKDRLYEWGYYVKKDENLKADEVKEIISRNVKSNMPDFTENDCYLFYAYYEGKSFTSIEVSNEKDINERFSTGQNNYLNKVIATYIYIGEDRIKIQSYGGDIDACY